MYRMHARLYVCVYVCMPSSLVGLPRAVHSAKVLVGEDGEREDVQAEVMNLDSKVGPTQVRIAFKSDTNRNRQ